MLQERQMLNKSKLKNYTNPKMMNIGVDVYLIFKTESCTHNQTLGFKNISPILNQN